MNAAFATMSAGTEPTPKSRSGMAARKKKSQDDATGKRGRGRPPVDNPKSRAYSARLDDELQEAWNQFMAAQSLPTSDAVVIRAALQMFFADRGFYPPKKPKA
jgi:hypothetical protein